jgi:hypothetical protein
MEKVGPTCIPPYLPGKLSIVQSSRAATQRRVNLPRTESSEVPEIKYPITIEKMPTAGSLC